MEVAIDLGNPVSSRLRWDSKRSKALIKASRSVVRGFTVTGVFLVGDVLGADASWLFTVIRTSHARSVVVKNRLSPVREESSLPARQAGAM
jgi:hypothetical protein